MPNFKVTIRRDVTSYDEFERVIVADDEFEALRAADDLAFEANHNCPDDCTELDTEIVVGDFFVQSAKLTDERADVD